MVKSKIIVMYMLFSSQLGNFEYTMATVDSVSPPSLVRPTEHICLELFGPSIQSWSQCHQESKHAPIHHTQNQVVTLA